MFIRAKKDEIANLEKLKAANADKITDFKQQVDMDKIIKDFILKK